MKQYTRYYQMSIECQYMSNICQTQMKGKWNNETNRRNKRKQEKGPRGVSRSEDSKTLSSRVRRFEDFKHHILMQHHKTSRDRQSVSNLKTLRWLHERFPLTITPPPRKAST